MELMEAIRGRRAIRSYTEDPITPETLKRLVDAAIQAPSAVNVQPWHFATRLRSTAFPTRPNRICYGRPRRTGRCASISMILTFIFYHAPALILISAAPVEWGCEDAALAAENLMLAAYAEGLGSCWIGFAQRWLETEEGKWAVGLQSGYTPVAPIIVGVPRETPPPVPRKPAAIHWLD